MQLFTTLFIYAALFVGVLIASEALFTIVRSVASSRDKRIERRLKPKSSGTRRSERSEADFLRSFDRRTNLPVVSAIERLVEQADAEIPLERVLLLMGGLAFLVFVVVVLVAPVAPVLLALVAAIIIGPSPILIYLLAKRAERRSKMEEQLPDALDLMVRSLKIGHPLSASISVVARELPDPIAKEFAIASEQVTFGRPLPEAISTMADRVPVPDLRYLSVAVQIHHEAGGNLAEILNGLSVVIRERFRMFRKVKAITAEGRFSAWFLSFFPFAIAFAIQVIKPNYYTQVADFAYFPHLVGLTLVLLAVNIVAMRIITDLKV